MRSEIKCSSVVTKTFKLLNNKITLKKEEYSPQIEDSYHLQTYENLSKHIYEHSSASRGK